MLPEAIEQTPMNAAPDPSFEIQEISYGVHKCEGCRFFRYLAEGQYVDFCVEHVFAFVASPADTAKFRALLPVEFKQLPLDDAQRQWRARAVGSMINFLRASVIASDVELGLGALDKFVA
jgi:hypothetical protein